MNLAPGTQVVLPDGTIAYFQRKNPDGSIVLLTYATVGPHAAKNVKAAK